MLKFFRRIRQKLLLKGKLKSYLIYAAGEVLLVMIGILLALQVSNWNTQRLETFKKEKLLHKMSNEIQSNIDRANHLIKRKEIGFSNSSRLENILTTASPLDSLDVFFNIFLVPFQLDHPNFNSSAYQEAQSTGALYNLGSDSLIFKIEEYYSLCERESYYMLSIGESAIQLIESSPWLMAMPEYLAINRYNVPKSFFLNQNKWLGDKTHPDYRRSSNLMFRSKTANRGCRNICNKIIAESEKLIAAVEEELKK